jgi:hypothetical protein
LQLRDQEQRLVTLVDQMVQGYHSGFAKSIQNYSQILQLFGDAKEQVIVAAFSADGVCLGRVPQQQQYSTCLLPAVPVT